MVARMFACLPAYFILVHMWDPTLSVERLPIPVNSRSCDPLKLSRKLFFFSLCLPHTRGGGIYGRSPVDRLFNNHCAR